MIKIIRDDRITWNEIEDNHKLYFQQVVRSYFNDFRTSHSDIHAKLVISFTNVALDDLSVCNRQMMNEYIEKYKADFLATFQKSFNYNDCDVKKTVLYFKEIFRYGSFRDNNPTISRPNGATFKWNRHALLSSMPVRVCPYCDRSYVTPYEGVDGQQRSTADCDHFYNQAKYPFLALSLYNLVPSCLHCNERLKLSVDFYSKPHVYPYEKGFDDVGAHFRTKNCSGDLSYILNLTDNFEIDIENPQCNTDVQNSIETFHLKPIYQEHKNIVKEIIEKVKEYPPSRIDELVRYGVFKDESDVKKKLFSVYIHSNNPSDPLTKLKKDIYSEMKERVIKGQ